MNWTITHFSERGFVLIEFFFCAAMTILGLAELSSSEEGRRRAPPAALFDRCTSLRRNKITAIRDLTDFCQDGLEMRRG